VSEPACARKEACRARPFQPALPRRALVREAVRRPGAAGPTACHRDGLEIWTGHLAVPLGQLRGDRLPLDERSQASQHARLRVLESMASAATSASDRERVLEARRRRGQPQRQKRAVAESMALAVSLLALLQPAERPVRRQRVLLLPRGSAQMARRPAPQSLRGSRLVLSQESEAGAAERLGAWLLLQALPALIWRRRAPRLDAPRAVAAARALQPA